MSHVSKNNKSAITVEPLLWIWSTNSDGAYPIKVRVTYRRKRKYYPVKHEFKNLFLSPADWNEVQNHSIKLKGKNKSFRSIIFGAVANAENAIKQATSNGRIFSFDRFEKEFLHQESDMGFLKLFESHLKALRDEERIGTFKSYNNAFQAFKKFRGNKEIEVFDITPDVLKRFENYLINPREERLSNGRRIYHIANKSTIAIYMRALKVVFNVAISRNNSLAECYPFSSKRAERSKFRIRNGAGKKGEALDIEQLRKLVAFNAMPGTPLWEAKAVLNIPDTSDPPIPGII
jgi:hypothetical protein